MAIYGDTKRQLARSREAWLEDVIQAADSIWDAATALGIDVEIDAGPNKYSEKNEVKITLREREAKDDTRTVD